MLRPPRDRRPYRFVKFVLQMDGCQDGCSQPVLGYEFSLAFERCPVTSRGGTGILVGGIVLSLSKYCRRTSHYWCKPSLDEKQQLKAWSTHSPQNT